MINAVVGISAAVGMFVFFYKLADWFEKDHPGVLDDRFDRCMDWVFDRLEGKP